MRFSKLLSLVTCGILLIGVLAPLAVAQKKDKDKDKNPPVPAVIPPTP